MKRQEIDLEGNFVESDKATENSNFSKGVNDFFREIEGPYQLIRGPGIRDLGPDNRPEPLGQNRSLTP